MFNPRPRPANASPPAVLTKTVTRGKDVVEETVTYPDGFRDLMKGDAAASLSCTLARGIEFNSTKVTFHLSVRCDQNEKMLDEAARRTFAKVLEYVTDAGALLWGDPPK